MKANRSDLVCWVFVLAAFALAVFFYDRLPENVPTHWNWRGEADGFTPKPFGPFVLPAIMAAMQLLFAIIPWISPKGYRIEQFQGAYDTMRVSTMGFLLMIVTFMLAAGAGYPVPMNSVVTASLGLLFIAMGWPMASLKRNFFVGIRTPWTLASERVWNETHRVGSMSFMGAGCVLLVSAAAGWDLLLPVLTILSVAFGTVLWSFILYKRYEGFEND